MVDAIEVRTKHETFALGLRGFHKPDVEDYLERIALIVDVIGEDPSHAPELPDDMSPAAVRTHEFDIVWRGFDLTEVRAYLQDLGNGLETMLSAGPTAAVLQLPASMADSTVRPGILTGSEITVQGQRSIVRFATPEGLTAELAAQLKDVDACVIPRTIIVADLQATTLRRAVTKLDESNQL